MLSEFLFIIAGGAAFHGIRLIVWPGYAERWAAVQRRNNRTLFVTAMQNRIAGVALLVVAAMLGLGGYVIWSGHS
jgi:hypothetical protein